MTRLVICNCRESGSGTIAAALPAREERDTDDLAAVWVAELVRDAPDERLPIAGRQSRRHREERNDRKRNRESNHETCPTLHASHAES